ncbi:Acyl-CoA synthetase (AMP-forming)/AMP-acid ligase II-like protein [Streptomyces lincolnensis]|uniref:Acyl-CoA synthetase (AMP-forming)/AMP-acid ligase II-like protein n=1 Tax=Streptomyces lincolnensis TaxID=1915 RepID=A0A1B1MQM6_STRLN|nr:AMP-binding protein [Streptomyces lincolnensis]ANS70722.1 Acyl-CoA synthetase (AMP-forming)/AMP-acid ligase II-like protein [Streptomyces lincolnensis]
MTETTVTPTHASRTGGRHDEIRFGTSGSTGEARHWFRLPHQMEREVELIGTRLVGPVDRVLNYAPPQHLFGALFGQWLPRIAGVPVHQAWADPFAPLPVSPGERVLAVCIPMAWDLLRRSLPVLERAGSVVALHSSAAAPPTAHELVRRAAPLLRAHEILGSTETGGLAHRPLLPEGPEGGDAGPWQALPDVSFVRDAGAPTRGPEELVIRGPRLARPEHGTRPPDRWATGDLVEFTGPRAFRLVGRSSSLIKVNGVKVHLARVDEQLKACLPQTECVVLPLPDDSLAGEGYVVFWSGRGHAVGIADVRAALRDFPSPSQIVELAGIPRTPTGKPDRSALFAEFAPTSA